MKKIVLFSTMLMLSLLSCTKENNQFASFSDANNVVSSNTNTTQSLTSAGCDDIILNALITGNDYNYDIQELIRVSRGYFQCLSSSQPELICCDPRRPLCNLYSADTYESSQWINGGWRYLNGSGSNYTLTERKQFLLDDCKALYNQIYTKYGSKFKIKTGTLTINLHPNNPSLMVTSIAVDITICKKFSDNPM
jgi:hypothetical protein